MSHPIAGVVLDHVVERAGALHIDERGIAAVASALGAALRDDPGPAVAALIEVAHFLDVDRKSPAASNTVLTIVFAAGPVLRALGDERSTAAAARIDSAQAKLKSFTDDKRVTDVLDSGARPAGTVAAGPLARFQVTVPAKK